MAAKTTHFIATFEGTEYTRSSDTKAYTHLVLTDQGHGLAAVRWSESERAANAFAKTLRNKDLDTVVIEVGTQASKAAPVTTAAMAKGGKQSLSVAAAQGKRAGRKLAAVETPAPAAIMEHLAFLAPAKTTRTRKATAAKVVAPVVEVDAVEVQRSEALAALVAVSETRRALEAQLAEVVAAQLDAIKVARTAGVKVADQETATGLSSTRLFKWVQSSK